MFLWNADKIRFLQNASEYTPFNDVLAGRAMVHFRENGHVLDAGCGLGYLSLALSKYCAQVTAADTSQEALSVLRENVQRRGIQNITILEGDVFALPEAAQFDNMAFCFFGSTEQILRCAKIHCLGNTVIFKKNWAAHRFTVKETPLTRFTFIQTCDELTKLGIPFISESFELDMGQPFHTLAEAAQFFQLHGPKDGGTLTEDALSARLMKTESTEFPYYLPANRPVGMITVDAGHIPDTIITNGGMKK